MTTYTAAQVTNLFLYGQIETPDDLTDESLIRRKDAPLDPLKTYVDQDLLSYMTTGAGRFAVAAQFDLVKDFFQRDEGGNYIYALGPGSYSKIDINHYMENLSFYGLNLQQYNFDDGQDDYVERTYIWNSTAFELDNGVGRLPVRTGWSPCSSAKSGPVASQAFECS